MRRSGVAWWGRLGVTAVMVVGAAGQAGAAGDEIAVNLIVPRYLVAGGQGAVVRAQVLDGGAPAPDGLMVSFSGTLGMTFDPVRAPTSGGLAVSIAKPADESGFARIDAVAEGMRSGAVLWVRPGPVARVASISAAPSPASAGQPVRVTAHLEDGFGNPSDGDRVTWTASGGTVTPSQAYVEAGLAATTFVAGAAGPAVVELQAGGAFGRVNLEVLGTGTVTSLWLPATMAAAPGSCTELLVNGAFRGDRDGDGVPDAWRIEGGGLAALLPGGGPAEGEPALRMTAPDGGTGPRASQEVHASPDLGQGVLRLWLRGAGPAEAALRVEVWSMGWIGSRWGRLPLTVEQIEVGQDWRLEVLPLPAPPSGTTTVVLSPRTGAGGEPVVIDVARMALSACP